MPVASNVEFGCGGIKSVVGGGWLFVVSKGDQTADPVGRFYDSVKANTDGHGLLLTDRWSREKMKWIVNCPTKEVAEKNLLRGTLSLRS